MASLVLAGFLGLTGLVLEQAYRASAEKAMKERLESQIYGPAGRRRGGSAGSSQPAQIALRIPASTGPTPATMPRSPVLVVGSAGNPPSMVGRQLSFLQPTPTWPAAVSTSRKTATCWRSAFGVSWEDFEANETDYVLAVAIDLSPHQQQIEAFRNTLFLWLGGVSLLLLLIQGLVLRWGLTPLRTVAVELEAIESGRSEQLQGRYPA